MVIPKPLTDYASRVNLVRLLDEAEKLEADLKLPQFRVLVPGDGAEGLYVLRRVTVQQIHLSKPGTDITRRFKKDGTELSALGCLKIHPEDLERILVSK